MSFRITLCNKSHFIKNIKILLINSLLTPCRKILVMETIQVSLLTNQQHNSVKLIAKESGIIAGVELAQIIFKQVNDSIQCTVNKQEGSQIIPRRYYYMTITGPQYDLLATERLVLNCIAHENC